VPRPLSSSTSSRSLLCPHYSPLLSRSCARLSSPFRRSTIICCPLGPRGVYLLLPRILVICVTLPIRLVSWPFVLPIARSSPCHFAINPQGKQCPSVEECCHSLCGAFAEDSLLSSSLVPPVDAIPVLLCSVLFSPHAASRVCKRDC
jgi:hypothetical protein